MKKELMAAAAMLLIATAAVAAGDERVVEKSFDFQGGGRVAVDIKLGGDIEIKGWDKDEIRARAVITGDHREDVDVDFDLDGSKLGIVAESSRRRNTDAECDLYLMVPAGTSVRFATLGGDIVMAGVEGSFKGRTMGGDVDFEKLTGSVDVTTHGGDIAVRDSELDGRVKTMGGDVDIRRVRGDLKGSSMGGDVTYEEVTGSGDDEDEDVSISTMGGDLDLDYEGRKVKARTLGGDVQIGRAREVEVSTMGGDIEVEEAPMGARVKTLGGDITVGSAGGFAKAKTMGGDIKLESVDGWIEAETMGGDVYARMVGDPDKGDRDVDLASKGGDIELIVPDGLSMDIDIEIEYTENMKKKPRIISDFDLSIDETGWERKWFSRRKTISGRGEHRGGENTIRIRTVNGNVTIRKAD